MKSALIIGHEKIWDFLSKSAEKNRLAHAYLFVGPAELGKKKLALEFVKTLQCSDSLPGFKACGICPDCFGIEKKSHPDISFVGLPETQEEKPVFEIKIEEARRIRHHLSLSPFSGKIKAVIIDSAENLNIEAANCLLKTIEEPFPKSLLILISSAWQKIPSTIISRCQIIKFFPVKKEQIQLGLRALGLESAAESEKAVAYCCGKPGAAIAAHKNKNQQERRNEAIRDMEKILKSGLAERFSYAAKLSKDANSASEILGYWLLWHRDKILQKLNLISLSVFKENRADCRSLKQISSLIRKIEKSQELLKAGGFNAKLVLENLMLVF